MASAAWPASACDQIPPWLRAPALQAGWTALKKAALNGHELAVDMLLDAGAHPNVPGADEVGARWTVVLDVLWPVGRDDVDVAIACPVDVDPSPLSPLHPR